MAEEKRNIYEKMTAVKTALLGIRKGGKNDFSHYSYFELGDILPVLTPALQRERLFMQTQFSATEQSAKLVIVDIDNTESKLEFECRFAECALKGAHEIQNYGAAQTYTRRYLIMTAFDIAEADIVDAGAEKEEKKPERAPYTKGAKQSPKKPEIVQLDIAKLKREIWELTKKLPEDQQAKWINMCKGAKPEVLLDIYEDITEILNAEAPQKELPKEETEEHKKRVEELKEQCITLLEKLIKILPADALKDWFEIIQNSNSIGKLCDYHSHLTKLINEEKKEPATPQGKPANQSNELEIF